MNETHDAKKAAEPPQVQIEVNTIKYGDHPETVIGVLKDRMACHDDKIVVAEGWCKRCGICVSVCPVKALSRKSDDPPVVDNAKCISCGTCELLCPDFAIIVRNLKSKPEKKA